MSFFRCRNPCRVTIITADITTTPRIDTTPKYFTVTDMSCRLFISVSSIYSCSSLCCLILAASFFMWSAKCWMQSRLQYLTCPSRAWWSLSSSSPSIRPSLRPLARMNSFTSIDRVNSLPARFSTFTITYSPFLPLACNLPLQALFSMDPSQTSTLSLVDSMSFFWQFSTSCCVTVIRYYSPYWMPSISAHTLTPMSLQTCSLNVRCSYGLMSVLNRSLACAVASSSSMIGCIDMVNAIILCLYFIFIPPQQKHFYYSIHPIHCLILSFWFYRMLFTIFWAMSCSFMLAPRKSRKLFSSSNRQVMMVWSMVQAFLRRVSDRESLSSSSRSYSILEAQIRNLFMASRRLGESLRSAVSPTMSPSNNFRKASIFSGESLSGSTETKSVLRLKYSFSGILLTWRTALASLWRESGQMSGQLVKPKQMRQQLPSRSLLVTLLPLVSINSQSPPMLAFP